MIKFFFNLAVLLTKDGHFTGFFGTAVSQNTSAQLLLNA